MFYAFVFVLRGGVPKFRIFPISMFPKLGPRGGGIIKFPIFPNCGLFPLFVNFFLFGGFPKMVLIAYTVTFWPISKTARLSQ